MIRMTFGTRIFRRLYDLDAAVDKASSVMAKVRKEINEINPYMNDAVSHVLVALSLVDDSIRRSMRWDDKIYVVLEKNAIK